MAYKKLFDPTEEEDLQDLRLEKERQESTTGDRRDGKVYVYDGAGDIVLAVNIALATGRPLLVSGPSGGGKSSLAHHVARVLGRRYYEFVVTARTQARDLTWRFDAVHRLADAQVEGVLTTPSSKAGDKDARAEMAGDEEEAPVETARGDEEPPPIRQAPKRSRSYLETIYPYIDPQALWWIFNRESARRRGRPKLDESDIPKDPVHWDPGKAREEGEWLPAEPQLDSCVLLIDEIDKADPDVPNNLLVELGSLQFKVDLIGDTIEFQGDRQDWKSRPLVIITTNKERPLPQPFVRRCIVLEVPRPKRGFLWDIAARNYPGFDQAFFDLVLDSVLASKGSPAQSRLDGNGEGDAASSQGQPADRSQEVVEVSIAEYLDTLRACVSLQEGDGDLRQELLDEIVKRTVWLEKEKALRP